MVGSVDPESETGDFMASAKRKFLSIPAFESVDDVMVGVYRDMKPEERLETALGMWLSARQMLYEAIRSFHSDWTEDQVERTVAERMLRGST